jgi:hypothetical protein
MQITPSSNLIAALSALQQPQRAQAVNATVGVPPVSGPTAPVPRPVQIAPQQLQPNPSTTPARPPSPTLGRYLDIKV